MLKHWFNGHCVCVCGGGGGSGFIGFFCVFFYV